MVNDDFTDEVLTEVVATAFEDATSELLSLGINVDEPVALSLEDGLAAVIFGFENC